MVNSAIVNHLFEHFCSGKTALQSTGTIYVLIDLAPPSASISSVMPSRFSYNVPQKILRPQSAIVSEVKLDSNQTKATEDDVFEELHYSVRGQRLNEV